MDRLTQPLRDEHASLRPQVDALREIADLAEQLPPTELAARLAAATAFLHGHLLVHAHVEEAALYPVVEWAIGGMGATATMARDHTEIARLARQVDDVRSVVGSGPVRPDELPRLRQVLYGLHAVIVLHFAKEEEIYLPLLDERLSPDAAARLFASMDEEAAKEAAA